jgi:hypothetical protein
MKERNFCKKGNVFEIKRMKEQRGQRTDKEKGNRSALPTRNELISWTEEKTQKNVCLWNGQKGRSKKILK